MSQLLSPEAGQLTDGQYADRPHLRAILDAVLTSLPTLGEVRVEARKTLVSLVSSSPEYRPPPEIAWISGCGWTR